jgi:dephospho-CoA kinase
MARTTLIGLTGGIAAGKTTVARMFVELGAPLVDADLLARQVTAPGTDTLRQVVEAFGQEVLSDDGELDRRALGRVVFGDEAARRRLEQITHPAIIRAARARVTALGRQGHRHVIYEAALLVETGRHEEMDRLVVVVADDELRVERLIDRDRLSREEARARLEAQLPQEQKAALADYVIDNSGPVEQSRAQVEDVWRRLQEE